MPDLRDDVRDLFTAITGRAPDGLWSAPGRLTLLHGETVSLAVDLDRRVLVAAGAREDAVLRIVSTMAGEAVELPLTELDAVPGDAGWAVLPLGVVAGLGADLAAVPGVDLVIESNVPVAAGLGSSVAITSAVALALGDLWRLDPARPDAERPDPDVLLATPAFAASGLTQLVLETGTSSTPTTVSDDAVREAADILSSDPAGFGAVFDETVTGSPELALAAEVAREQGALATRATTNGTVIAIAPVDAVSRIQVGLDGAFAEHGFAQPEVYPVSASTGAARDG